MSSLFLYFRLSFFFYLCFKIIIYIWNRFLVNYQISHLYIFYLHLILYIVSDLHQFYQNIQEYFLVFLQNVYYSANCQKNKNFNFFHSDIGLTVGSNCFLLDSSCSKGSSIKIPN